MRQNPLKTVDWSYLLKKPLMVNFIFCAVQKIVRAAGGIIKLFDNLPRFEKEHYLFIYFI